MHSFLKIKILFLVLVFQVFSARCCVEHEREALLEFKAGVTDPSNRLASWRDDECCDWAGVLCSNKTGHVIVLNLRNTYFYMYPDGYPEHECNNHSLSGKISPSLQNMSELKHLDLSYNNFSGNKFPNFISSFKNLNYLNLSSTGFSGMIPSQLGNLSKLQHLDLSFMPDTYISDAWSLSHLTSLTHLDMSQVNFRDSRNWVQALNTLPLLQSLHLGSNNLTTIPTSIPELNFSSLQILVIIENEFNSRIPDWIGKLTTLTALELWFCFFVGKLPNQLGNLTSLNQMYLLDDNLEGPMPPLHNLKNLTELCLWDVNIGEDIRVVMSKLANETLDKFEVLVLGNANLTGNLTDWLSKIPNLKELCLGGNNLNGTIPIEIGNLTSLEYLFLNENNLNGTIPIEIGNLTSLQHLSLYENYLIGEVSESHLTGLSNLKELDLSSNYVTITVNMNWVPPFQLDYLYLSGCKLGHHFPPWLQNQSQIMDIELSHTAIVDTVPNWFWKFQSLNYIDLSSNNMSGKLPLSLEHLTMLDRLVLSDNQFEGGIPTLPRAIEYIDMSNNHFSGQLPTNVKAPDLLVLVISNNNFNGTIEQLTCGLDSLTILNMAQNNLSGNLPRCLPGSLRVVNLAHNNLLGVIPSSIGSLNLLWILQLNNNNLSGELPSALQYCQNLTVLDLGENKFTGQIPEWMGENLRNLTILRLRSNLFSSAIPVQLVKLQYLQVLDLANNKIFGMIPQNIDLLSSMASRGGNNNNSDFTDFLSNNQNYYNVSVSITMKDLDLEYTTSLSLLKSIDLSGNNLTGMIPNNITTLHGLENLNLSNNHLTGSIPLEIGEMSSIESLDLHVNELSGVIPQSLSNLNFLSILNVSYNNLSGKIPIGNQLQTLNDLYIYVGNSYLCGPSLNKSCDVGNVNNSQDYVGKASEDLNKVLLYLFVILGFGCGIWVVFGVLVFKINWRHLFFNFVDNSFETIYILMWYILQGLGSDESKVRKL